MSPSVKTESARPLNKPSTAAEPADLGYDSDDDLLHALRANETLSDEEESPTAAVAAVAAAYEYSIIDDLKIEFADLNDVFLVNDCEDQALDDMARAPYDDLDLRVISHEWHREDIDRRTGEVGLQMSNQRTFVVVVEAESRSGAPIDGGLQVSATLMTDRTHKVVLDVLNDEYAAPVKAGISPLLLEAEKKCLGSRLATAFQPHRPLPVLRDPTDAARGTVTVVFRLGEAALSDRCGRDKPDLYLLFQPSLATASDMALAVKRLAEADDFGPSTLAHGGLPFCRSAPFHAITRLRPLPSKESANPPETFSSFEERVRHFRIGPRGPPNSVRLNGVLDGVQHHSDSDGEAPAAGGGAAPAAAALADPSVTVVAAPKVAALAAVAAVTAAPTVPRRAATPKPAAEATSGGKPDTPATGGAVRAMAAPPPPASAGRKRIRSGTHAVQPATPAAGEAETSRGEVAGEGKVRKRARPSAAVPPPPLPPHTPSLATPAAATPASAASLMAELKRENDKLRDELKATREELLAKQAVFEAEVATCVARTVTNAVLHVSGQASESFALLRDQLRGEMKAERQAMRLEFSLRLNDVEHSPRGGTAVGVAAAVSATAASPARSSPAPSTAPAPSTSPARASPARASRARASPAPSTSPVRAAVSARAASPANDERNKPKELAADAAALLSPPKTRGAKAAVQEGMAPRSR